MRGTNILEAPVRQETLTERYTEEAVRFIRKNRDRPFFLYLAHTFPHTPLHASQRFRGKSKGKLYGDTVECIDWSTGQILDTLKQLDLDGKTLVCFTSDNGAPPGGQLKNVNGAGTNGPLRGVKFTSYEGGFRVPAIFRWPGKIPAGRTCNELAAAMDLFPTFARLADANVPNDRVIDGKNIWPLLADTHAKTPHDLFCYYLDNQLQAVRSGDWKLFLEQQQFPKLTTIMYTNRPQVMEKHFALRDRSALYNLRSDLGEKHDVAAQHPDIVKRLTDLAHSFDNSLKSNQRAEAVLPP
jgi:arylsulfatase A-like enzyme